MVVSCALALASASAHESVQRFLEDTLGHPAAEQFTASCAAYLPEKRQDASGNLAHPLFVMSYSDDLDHVYAVSNDICVQAHRDFEVLVTGTTLKGFYRKLHRSTTIAGKTYHCSQGIRVRLGQAILNGAAPGFVLQVDHTESSEWCDESEAVLRQWLAGLPSSVLAPSATLDELFRPAGMDRLPAEYSRRHLSLQYIAALAAAL